MLTEITLTNFKCFSSQQIALRPLTVLSGLNGVGKSTVIQSLLLLRQSVLQQMLPGRGLLLNGQLVSLGTASDVLNRSAEVDEVGFALNGKGGRYDWRFAYDNPHSDVLEVTAEPGLVPGLPLFGNQFHYLAAERVGPRAIYDMSYYEVGQQYQMGPDGRYAVAFLDQYRDKLAIKEVCHPEAVDATIGSQVNAWFGEISPGSQLTTLPFPEISKLRLGFEFDAGMPQSRLFSPPNVGFGLSYVLPVIVALVTASPGTLVLIENPEAHLHPHGQVAIGRLISQVASAGVQVIVETHSEHVLNGVRLSAKRKQVLPSDISLLFFERQKSSGQLSHRVQSPKLDADGRIDLWPAGFFDQWEDALELL